MSANLPDGHWGRSDKHPMKFHFFLEGETNCLCGVLLASEITGETEKRRTGGMDCKTCASIREELEAPQPTADPGPDWTVTTDPIEGNHVLFYQGKPQSAVRGAGGLATQKELAAIFNRNGTLPKKGKKIRCAADAPSPEKYVAKNAAKSPELPLAPAFTGRDFAELIRYLRSLFDDSPLGSHPKPAFFEEVMHAFGDVVPSEFTLFSLSWLGCLTCTEREQVETFLRQPKCTAEPDCLVDFEKEKGRLTPAERKQLLQITRFVICHDSTPLTSTNTMPAKQAATTAQPETTELTAILTPASHFVRWPTNREIPSEKVKIMTDSIRKSGIINPIIARTLPGKPELEIIAGETRWKAAKAIDAEFLIPTFIRTLSDKDAAMLHAIDNFQRNDLNPIEQAREIQHMLDTGWNLDEIMERLGLAKDSIYNRLALLKLPEEGQAAFLDGNLSMHTVRKIMSLPEDIRVSAIEAVTSPTHSASPMAEREAVAFLQKRYVLPMEEATAWEEKHTLLTTENPGCQWLKYEQAKDAERNFCRAGEIPGWRYISDAARSDELVVPTWGELAKKHGSPIYIGMNYQGEAALFVSPDPIVDAEKALMDDKPEECIFTHEKAVQKNRDAAERKKLEQQAHREALAAETKKLQNLILAPDALKATVIKKLVEATVFEVWEFYLEFNELADLFDIPEDTEFAARQKKIEAAVFKYLRSKSFTPFEAMARVHMAGALGGRLNGTEVLAIFDSGACKPAEFPAHHIEYLKAAERAAEEAKLQEAREEARREAIARGDAPTGEENAA